MLYHLLQDGSVPADTFTTDLQKELNSQRQPGLAPFLNVSHHRSQSIELVSMTIVCYYFHYWSYFLQKSLPELQAAVMGRRLSIIGLGNDWIPTATKSQPTAVSYIPEFSPLALSYSECHCHVLSVIFMS